MRVYLVGGACRDILLGQTPKDYDFVVVGSSPSEMISLGFKQVGADFPVFLHPVTEDEYALARIERKVGIGYKDFETAWKGVTLEEDLTRRDLTVNSMAMEVEVDLETGEIVSSIGKIIDPFNGQQDLKDKILRHTSEAFAEDSVRILRIARFLARYGDKWTIASETLKLMDKIYYSGELNHLVPERVFLEMKKALIEKTPSLFFTTLYRYGIFKEIDMLYGVPQRKDHHPEVEYDLERLWVK